MDTILEERKEQFQKCLHYVATYFDLDPKLIMIKRSEEHTNARYIIVRTMCDLYSDGEVSKIVGLTRSGVNTIKNKFGYKFNSPNMLNLYSKLHAVLKTYFQV